MSDVADFEGYRLSRQVDALQACGMCCYDRNGAGEVLLDGWGRQQWVCNRCIEDLPLADEHE